MGSACVQVFMVSADAELNTATLKHILASGHSRVPVHASHDRHSPFRNSLPDGYALGSLLKAPGVLVLELMHSVFSCASRPYPTVQVIW